MKTAGIICECNPMHAGHAYLVERARESGAEVVIGVMSGCFVQRGEAAVADPYARAEILVRCGFDAVVELPFPYAAAGAEFFGAAGVEILERLGVNEIWFGSECGDIDTLKRVAAVAESAEFAARYSANAHASDGTARAYFDLLGRMCADAAVSFDPNDILALSYLRAILRTGARITPFTRKREGSGYADEVLGEGFPSASALRRAWREGGLGAIRDRLSAPCHEILAREVENGRAPADMRAIESLILGHFRLQQGCGDAAEMGGGLAERFAHAARKASTLDELYSLCATKKYTDARLRRGVLFSLCGVTDGDLRAPVAYTRLLAANRTGCAFLSSVRKSATVPVVTRAADIPTGADRERALEERARLLWSLTVPVRESGEVLLTRTPTILGEK